MPVRMVRIIDDVKLHGLDFTSDGRMVVTMEVLKDYWVPEFWLNERTNG